MELIDRYVYAVTKGLPESQRGDIDKELRTLIDDMVEEMEGPDAYEAKVKDVLLKLGDPADLAGNYHEAKRYLIGPQLYEKYLLVLKIVLGAIFIGISVAVAVGAIFSSTQSAAGIISEYIASLFSALLQGFAWTTIAFAIAERNTWGSIDSSEKKKSWTLSELPVIPNEKARISLAEPIVSILFSAIFMAIFYFHPELFAAYFSGDYGKAVIPVFNIDILKDYRIFFVFIFLFSIIKEVFKLISRRWTMRLSVAVSLLSVLSTIMMLVVFANPLIWNPDFGMQVMEYTHMDFDLASLWERLPTGFVAILIIILIIDVGSALLKGFRYRTK